MRKKEIKCPYCGSKAKLVHFYDIYGKDATHPERYAWASEIPGFIRIM